MRGRHLHDGRVRPLGHDPLQRRRDRRDTVDPVERGRDFASTLAATSRQPVVWSEPPDAQHSFDLFASLRARLVVDRIEAFTARVRSHEARVRR